MFYFIKVKKLLFLMEKKNDIRSNSSNKKKVSNTTLLTDY